MMPDAYLRFRDEFIALDPERYPADYIDRQVWTGAWRVWGDERAAIIAELKRYPSGVLEVVGIAAAGDLSDIIGLIAEAEDWGRANGASAAEVESRPGWVKALAPYGYELVQVKVRKSFQRRGSGFRKGTGSSDGHLKQQK